MHRVITLAMEIMKIHSIFHLLSFSVFLLACLFLHSFTAEGNQHSSSLKRSDFPADFVFGAASAAYQYEGAVSEGGRGPSIWDTFTYQHPEKIADQSNGDVAVDFYHRYKDDIRMLKNIGMNAFRFSISWTRILPDGKIRSGVNAEGVQFYNNVINELIENDIIPFVTLFHWDVPQALEDEYGGFRHSNIVDDYLDYVDLCFKEFGDRVKHWITVNEPYVFTTSGYELGIGPPGRCSSVNCTAGNSATEPYIVGHNLLLAHAAAVDVYKSNYQTSQQGEIGIVQGAFWYFPQNITQNEIEASNKAMDSHLGWFMHPLVYGEYPLSLKEMAGKNLPEFSMQQSEMLKGSYDFIGLNYYLAGYPSPSGKASLLDNFFVYPEGIQDLMLYVKDKYKDPVIYITENGLGQQNNRTLSSEEAIKDKSRVQYYKNHLSYLHQAIIKGAKVKGHIAWSFLDDFEWSFGYTLEYGLIYVDRQNGLKRYPKDSAMWYKDFLAMQTESSVCLSRCEPDSVAAS